MNITRRKFLHLAGLMGGASLFAGCHLFEASKPVPTYISGAPGVDPTETLKGVLNLHSVCGLCPGNCGIRCRVAEGTLVKIGGSPYHPVSSEKPLPFDTPLDKALLHGGAICAIGGSGIQTLYNPFRVIRPLKRIGPRGSARWRALEWDEAISEILAGGNLFGEGQVDGLTGLKDSGDGPTFLVGNADWGSLTFLKRFLAAFPGSTLQRDQRSVLCETARLAADAVFGAGTGAVAASFSTARFVLSFGDAPLDSGVPLVSVARDIANARLSSPGFQWAVVDPRLSTSASKADMWLPIIPGRDLELALALMRALVDDYPDRAKFPDDGLKKSAMSRTVEDYAAECGIAKDTILQCARFLAEEGQRCAVIPGGGVLAQQHGVETAKAVLTLNLMVGSKPGAGGLISRSDPFVRDAEKVLVAGKEKNWTPKLYGTKTKTLILWEADPVYDDPGSAESYFKNRQKVPLFVAIDREITETSALADYILPDTTYLERWDICLSPPSGGGTGIGVRSPVVGLFDSKSGKYSPIFPHAKPMEDIVFLLGAGLGLPGFERDKTGRVKTAWNYYDEALLVVLKSLQEHGFPLAPTKDDLAKVLERGGIFAPHSAKLPSPKVASSAGNYQPPVVEQEMAEQQAEKGLRVITYTLPFHRSPRSGLNSWLLEVLPENRLQINTEDARLMKIKDLDIITLESVDKQNRVQCKAQVLPGIRPGVVALAKGFGYKQGGASPFAIDGKPAKGDKTKGRGFNPTQIATIKVTPG